MSSPSKKRKHRDDDDRRKAKKARKHRDKSAGHEFAHVDADIVVAVPPVFAAAPADGVIEMLDSMLMRYIQPLRGVVLSHSDLRFLDSKAELRDASPFAICHVAFRTIVWSPRIGQRLTGHITLSSPDHVALLVHRTFNAAIPAAHVPRNEWEFVPDADSEDDPMAEEADDAAAVAEEARTTTGRWVHTRTREPLGGPQRTLTFTVIGLTIANQMLSVVGSILPDPFVRPQAPAAEEPEPVPEPELDPAPASEPAAAGDDDIFAALGRSTDAATQRTKHHKRKDRARDGEKPHKKKHKHPAQAP